MNKGAPMFRGSGFAGYRLYLIEALGKEGYRRFVRDELTPELRELFGEDPDQHSKILVSTLYPVELQHRLLEAVARVRPSTAADDMRAMGHTVAINDLTKGIYRIFVKMLSPEATLSTVTIVWNRYFTAGRAEVLEKRSGHFVVCITDAHQHPLHFHVACGFGEQAAIIAGAKQARADFVNGPGADQITMTIDWSM